MGSSVVLLIGLSVLQKGAPRARSASLSTKTDIELPSKRTEIKRCGPKDMVYISLALWTSQCKSKFAFINNLLYKKGQDLALKLSSSWYLDVILISFRLQTFKITSLFSSKRHT